jgi:AcrR family transcriptional regulator
MSAAERREAAIRAARTEFAQGGYAGTSTEAIARRIGVSQPYLFRLFPSKKALYLAAIDRCFDDLRAMFDEAAIELHGEDALAEMGRAYNALLDNSEQLQLQLQMWATACQDDEVRTLTRRRLSELWQQIQRLSGAGDQRVMTFMASGMLLNVFAALGLPRIKEQLGEALTGLAPEVRLSAPE